MEHGARVAAVTLGKPYEAKMFCASRSPDIVCLSNPDQSAYRLYGIDRAGLRAMIDPAVALGTVRTTLKGFMPRATDADMLQMSATFVIDQSGIVRFAHYNKHLADHPDVKKLMEVIQDLKK